MRECYITFGRDAAPPPAEQNACISSQLSRASMKSTSAPASAKAAALHRASCSTHTRLLRHSAAVTAHVPINCAAPSLQGPTFALCEPFTSFGVTEYCSNWTWVQAERTGVAHLQRLCLACVGARHNYNVGPALVPGICSCSDPGYCLPPCHHPLTLHMAAGLGRCLQNISQFVTRHS